MAYGAELNEATDLLQIIPQEMSGKEVAYQIDRAAEESYNQPIDPEYDEYLELIERFEGRRHHVYLDGKGHPTSGVGHKLSNRTFESEQSPAFKAEYGGVLYADETIDRWLIEDVDREYARLKKVYAKGRRGELKYPEVGHLDFDDLPLAVRGTLLDMAFNMGGNFGEKYPALFHRLRIGDMHGAALEMMYHNGAAVRAAGNSRYSQYYMSNNGPDLHSVTGRPIYVDDNGNNYTERTETLALDSDYNIVDPKTTGRSYLWYNVPTVNPELGTYYGSKWVDNERQDRTVYPDLTRSTVDYKRAIARERDRGSLSTGYKTVDEAEVAAQDHSTIVGNSISSDVNIARPDTRANVNVAAMLNAADPNFFTTKNSKPPTPTNAGKTLQEELRNVDGPRQPEY